MSGSSIPGSADLADLLPGELDAWPAALDALGEPMRSDLGAALVRAWIEGALEPRWLPAATRDPAALVALRRRLAGVLAPFNGWEHEWELYPLDEDAARRWCWIEPWLLASQDEDLSLMRDTLVVPLLEEIAARCPKRDYALSIVAHHLRDQVHGALRTSHDAMCARIRTLAPFRAPAAAAEAPALVAWLDRLAALESPGPVDEAAARARIADVWRCRAPDAFTLEPTADGWRAATGALRAHDESIAIARHTGALRIEAPWRERAARKGRHR